MKTNREDQILLMLSRCWSDSGFSNFHKKKFFNNSFHLWAPFLSAEPPFCMTNINRCRAGSPHWRGRLSTVDLLALTSLDNLLLIMQTLFSFYKICYLNEEVNGTEPPLQLGFPAERNDNLKKEQMQKMIFFCLNQHFSVN